MPRAELETIVEAALKFRAITPSKLADLTVAKNGFELLERMKCLRLFEHLMFPTSLREVAGDDLALKTRLCNAPKHLCSFAHKVLCCVAFRTQETIPRSTQQANQWTTKSRVAPELHNGERN